MHMKLLSLALGALVFAHAMPSLADESESETPEEERKAKEAEVNDIPQAVIDHIAYLEELQARYPDMGKADAEALVEREGEKAALLYCKAIGFDGPCTIDESKADAQFEAVAADSLVGRAAATGWWRWLKASNVMEVGVIPDGATCAGVSPQAPAPLVTIHMDDEDRRNNNSRWGWIGGTTSNGNTTWRFCRVAGFLPLSHNSPDANYAVLQLGMKCPSGARSIGRWQDNEDRRNANWSSGNTYPNVNVRGRNWLTYYCHFDGGKFGVDGMMDRFPKFHFAYGVFATSRMPSHLAAAYGEVYQDDEDWFNINRWDFLHNTAVMGGGSNTWRKLVKVR